MNRRAFWTAKKQDGLTLMEVLLVATLIVIVWAGAFQVFIFAAGLNRTNQNLTLASRDLTTIMEHMSSLEAEGRSVLLSSDNFPVNWGCPTANCSVLAPCLPQETPMHADHYDLIGGKKIGDANSETINYVYPGFVRTVDCGQPDPISPDSLTVQLLVTWTERGREMSLNLTNILRE